jgi:hypothetical protein
LFQSRILLPLHRAGPSRRKGAAKQKCPQLVVSNPMHASLVATVVSSHPLVPMEENPSFSGSGRTVLAAFEGQYPATCQLFTTK